MPLARDTDLTGGKLRGVVGKLERVRINAASYSSTGGGQSSSSLGETGSTNRDGWAQRVILTTVTSTPPAAPGRSVLRDVVYGRVVGVRWLSNNASTLYPFDVVIDGVAYRVDDVAPKRDNSIVAATDNECFKVIADDLPDTAHTVEVILTASSTIAKRLEIFGWLAEAGRGYTVPPEQRIGTVLDSPVTLTTTAASVPYTNLVQGLSFINTDTVVRTVTLAIGGQTYRTVTVPAAAGGVEGCAQVTFPTPRRLASHTWKADAASVVKAFTEGI